MPVRTRGGGAERGTARRREWKTERKNTMACDRFIRFQGSPLPTRVDVGQVIFEFVGEDNPGIEVKLTETKLYVINLAGKPGYPTEHWDQCPYRDERFVEVNVQGERKVRVVDVITRQADPLINAIADGLQDYIARRLGGSKGLAEDYVEEPSVPVMGEEQDGSS
jgi:hypothetical protein